ncbi:unnamed protein product [Amoebophrya sp. A25]|nr:unnamed protein product [Amoebophrya sp. A25]|eukprot:GSA25T00001485001.1
MQQEEVRNQSTSGRPTMRRSLLQPKRRSLLLCGAISLIGNRATNNIAEAAKATTSTIVHGRTKRSAPRKPQKRRQSNAERLKKLQAHLEQEKKAHPERFAKEGQGASQAVSGVEKGRVAAAGRDQKQKHAIAFSISSQSGRVEGESSSSSSLTRSKNKQGTADAHHEREIVGALEVGHESENGAAESRKQDRVANMNEQLSESSSRVGVEAVSSRVSWPVTDDLGRSPPDENPDVGEAEPALPTWRPVAMGPKREKVGALEGESMEGSTSAKVADVLADSIKPSVVSTRDIGVVPNKSSAPAGPVGGDVAAVKKPLAGATTAKAEPLVGENSAQKKEPQVVVVPHVEPRESQREPHILPHAVQFDINVPDHATHHVTKDNNDNSTAPPTNEGGVQLNEQSSVPLDMPVYLNHAEQEQALTPAVSGSITSVLSGDAADLLKMNKESLQIPAPQVEQQAGSLSSVSSSSAQIKTNINNIGLFGPTLLESSGKSTSSSTSEAQAESTKNEKSTSTTSSISTEASDSSTAGRDLVTAPRKNYAHLEEEAADAAAEAEVRLLEFKQQMASLQAQLGKFKVPIEDDDVLADGGSLDQEHEELTSTSTSSRDTTFRRGSSGSMFSLAESKRTNLLEKSEAALGGGSTTSTTVVSGSGNSKPIGNARTSSRSAASSGAPTSSSSASSSNTKTSSKKNKKNLFASTPIEKFSPAERQRQKEAIKRGILEAAAERKGDFSFTPESKLFLAPPGTSASTTSSVAGLDRTTEATAMSEKPADASISSSAGAASKLIEPSSTGSGASLASPSSSSSMPMMTLLEDSTKGVPVKQTSPHSQGTSMAHPLNPSTAVKRTAKQVSEHIAEEAKRYLEEGKIGKTVHHHKKARSSVEKGSPKSFRDLLPPEKAEQHLVKNRQHTTLMVRSEEVPEITGATTSKSIYQEEMPPATSSKKSSSTTTTNKRETEMASNRENTPTSSTTFLQMSATSSSISASHSELLSEAGTEDGYPVYGRRSRKTKKGPCPFDQKADEATFSRKRSLSRNEHQSEIVVEGGRTSNPAMAFLEVNSEPRKGRKADVEEQEAHQAEAVTISSTTSREEGQLDVDAEQSANHVDVDDYELHLAETSSSSSAASNSKTELDQERELHEDKEKNKNNFRGTDEQKKSSSSSKKGKQGSKNNKRQKRSKAQVAIPPELAELGKEKGHDIPRAKAIGHEANVAAQMAIFEQLYGKASTNMHTGQQAGTPISSPSLVEGKRRQLTSLKKAGAEITSFSKTGTETSSTSSSFSSTSSRTNTKTSHLGRAFSKAAKSKRQGKSATGASASATTRTTSSSAKSKRSRRSKESGLNLVEAKRRFTMPAVGHLTVAGKAVCDDEGEIYPKMCEPDDRHTNVRCCYTSNGEVHGLEMDRVQGGGILKCGAEFANRIWSEADQDVCKVEVVAAQAAGALPGVSATDASTSARICEFEEIRDNEAAGIGCGFDTTRVWTNTPCYQLGTYFHAWADRSFFDLHPAAEPVMGPIMAIDGNFIPSGVGSTCAFAPLFVDPVTNTTTPFTMWGLRFKPGQELMKVTKVVLFAAQGDNSLNDVDVTVERGPHVIFKELVSDVVPAAGVSTTGFSLSIELPAGLLGDAVTIRKQCPDNIFPCVKLCGMRVGVGEKLYRREKESII